MQTVIALGTFDGVHLGHKMLFDKANEIAEELNLSPLAFSFGNNPANFLTPYHPVKIITPKKEKLRRIKNCIKNVYIADFGDYAEMSAREFFLLLVYKFNARAFVCGFNFNFGKNREGNSETLKALCDEFGFRCEVVGGVTDGETVISSTNIRRLISMGRLSKANSLLTEEYAIYGKVVKGKRVGRKLGIPTLNQKLNPISVKLPYGVYLTKVEVKGKTYKAVTNIGICPTFGNREERAESHIIENGAKIPKDFAGYARVVFYKKLRDEVQFENPKQLKEQIKSDISACRAYFAKNKAK